MSTDSPVESPDSFQPSSRTAGAEGKEAGRAGCRRMLLGYPFAVALWVFLLRGFVETPTLLTLAAFGPLLAIAGIRGLALTVSTAPRAFKSPWYFGAFLAGLLLAAAGLGGAALTLAPQAPARWLITTTTGWNVLERRVEHLRKALAEGDIDRAQRLAERGLGDAAPLGAGDRPLIFDVREPERLAVLLQSGLDPNARDAEGRTLLAATRDLEIARTLIAAGADPNARDRNGATPLMLNGSYEEGYLRLLLEAGADVHAANDLGKTVADHYPTHGALRRLLEEHAEDRPLRAGRELAPLERGRRDWLTVERDPVARLGSSTMTIDPSPVGRGEVARLDIRLANDTDADRLLEVEAHLNEAALLVAASHSGAVADPRQIRPWQTIRWPLLALPAHSQGGLTLEVVVRADDEIGDLSVDLSTHDRLSQEEEVLRVYESPRVAGEPVVLLSLRGLLPVAVSAVLMIAAWLAIHRVRRLGRRARRERDSAARREYRRRYRRAFRSTWRVIAGCAVLLCAGLAIFLIAEGAKPYLRFDETTCTVLDRRAQPRTIEPIYRRSERMRRRLPPGDDKPTSYNEPLVAVRVDTAGGPLYTTGFALGMASPSSLSFQELRAFPLGATVPCWVDPDNPTAFTLARRPNLGWIVFLAMLLGSALALGFATWWLGRRVPDTDEDSVPPDEQPLR